MDAGASGNEMMAIDSDESWETDEEGAVNEEVKRSPRYVGNFFEAERFNPVYLNDSIITWWKLPRGTACPVASFFVVSPSQFFVQFEHTRGQLQELNSYLNDYCEQLGMIAYVYNVSEICVVHFQGQWRRAAVVERKAPCEVGGDWSYKVHFLDYGFTEAVEPANMRPLIRSCFRTPVQAYCCSLYGITPRKGSWSQESIQYFKSQMESKFVKSIRLVDDRGDGRISVRMEIEVPNATKCADVASLLIEAGYAKLAEKMS